MKLILLASVALRWTALDFTTASISRLLVVILLILKEKLAFVTTIIYYRVLLVVLHLPHRSLAVIATDMLLSVDVSAVTAKTSEAIISIGGQQTQNHRCLSSQPSFYHQQIHCHYQASRSEEGILSQSSDSQGSLQSGSLLATEFSTSLEATGISLH